MYSIIQVHASGPAKTFLKQDTTYACPNNKPRNFELVCVSRVRT